MAVLWGQVFAVGSWKIGLWMERRFDVDTLAQKAWADSLVGNFSVRVPGGAQLERLVFVPPGSLPLAGGDPNEHPDLRETGLDAMWGVRYLDTIGGPLAERIERSWLWARGCPDERGFGIGWDVFLLPKDPANKPDSALWKMDARHYVRFPAWRLLPDTGLEPLCRKLVQADPPGTGPHWVRLDTLLRRLGRLLPRELDVRVLDEGDRPAPSAILELWRSKPDPRRPYAARLEGRPDTLRADAQGRFPVRTGLGWFTRDSLVHGLSGSNATTYWRVRHGKRWVEGWLDATDMARLADSGKARLVWRMPSGSSAAWKEANAKWPAGWLAAQADSGGLVTLGVSVPEETDYVVRLVDGRGKEFLKTRPIHFPKGVHERIFSANLPEGYWDVRLDGPSERWQVRIYQPPIARTSVR